MKIESVYYELTNLCNLNCQTCYNRSGLNQTRLEIPLDALFASIEQFKRHGLRSVQLSGGETMLYSQIEGLFERIRAIKTLPFTISTNGTVKADYLADSYRNIPNLYVQISLDGSSEEINARTRGKGHFAKSLGLLDALHNSSRATGYRIKMVLSRHNLDDIPAYFKLAQDHDCVPQFSFMSAIGNGSDHWDSMALSDSEKMKALRYIDECNKTFQMEVKLPFCAFSCPFAKLEEEPPLSCMVKPNGDIMPCQCLYDEQFKLGNIHSFSEEEIKENLNKLQKIVCTRQETDYHCQNCLIEPLCKRGCPAMGYLNGGDILANDGECSFRLKHYLKYQFRTSDKT